MVRQYYLKLNKLFKDTTKMFFLQRDETATCPNCRTEISKTLSSRNLAVEKAVSELPAQCRYCSHEYSRNTVEKHEKELCEERYFKIERDHIFL